VGEAWHPGAGSRSPPRRPGKQEVAMGAPGSSTQQLPELNDEDKAMFAKIPLAFGVF
jgi:hypothetical protein